jgi:hypothetical protein
MGQLEPSVNPIHDAEAIHPISEDVDRLFITSESVVTLRNRLGPQTLTSLAELKTHFSATSTNQPDTTSRIAPTTGTPQVTSPPTHPQPSSAFTSPPDLDAIPTPDDIMNVYQVNHNRELFARHVGGDNDNGKGQMPSDSIMIGID